MKRRQFIKGLFAVPLAIPAAKEALAEAAKNLEPEEAHCNTGFEFCDKEPLITVSGGLAPDSANSYNLGDAAMKWEDDFLYVNTGSGYKKVKMSEF